MDFNLFCSSLHQNSIIPLQRHLKRSNWLSNWEQGVPGKQGLPESALTVELIGCDIKLVLRFSLQPDESVLVKYLKVFQKPTTGRGKACEAIELGPIANFNLQTGDHFVEMFREIAESQKEELFRESNQAWKKARKAKRFR